MHATAAERREAAKQVQTEAVKVMEALKAGWLKDRALRDRVLAIRNGLGVGPDTEISFDWK